MSWVVYCLATTKEPICTYIGATVDADRRLAQHNGEQKGGAKATGRRPGEWYRVCHVIGFADNHQALSFEWHWKYYSKKIKADPLTRRRKGLDACMEWANTKIEGVQLEIVYN
jgi:predicted GIY-YIG superfamily endonuclease